MQPLASPPSQASPHDLPYLIRAGPLKGARSPQPPGGVTSTKCKGLVCCGCCLGSPEAPLPVAGPPHPHMPPHPHTHPSTSPDTKQRAGAKGSLMSQTPWCLGHICGRLPHLGEARGTEERFPPCAPAELQLRKACGCCAGRGPGAKGALLGGGILGDWNKENHCRGNGILPAGQKRPGRGTRSHCPLLSKRPGEGQGRGARSPAAAENVPCQGNGTHTARKEVAPLEPGSSEVEITVPTS